MTKSEVARFREEQERCEQAALLGLCGYAEGARHQFIEKRMEQGAVYLQRLMDEGRHEEAIALMNTDDWEGIACQMNADDERQGG